jgi:hypothetical protein
MQQYATPFNIFYLLYSYPFRGGLFENKTYTATLNNTSDPYTPYYPGDAYVDWVGLSIYHYGGWYHWRQNLPPAPGEFEALMRGNAQPPMDWRQYGNNWPFYDFYGIFALDGKGSLGQVCFLTYTHRFV